MGTPRPISADGVGSTPPDPAVSGGGYGARVTQKTADDRGLPPALAEVARVEFPTFAEDIAALCR